MPAAQYRRRIPSHKPLQTWLPGSVRVLMVQESLQNAVGRIKTWTSENEQIERLMCAMSESHPQKSGSVVLYITLSNQESELLWKYIPPGRCFTCPWPTLWQCQIAICRLPLDKCQSLHLKVGLGRSSLPTPKMATAKKCMTRIEGLGLKPDNREMGPSLYQPPRRR